MVALGDASFPTLILRIIRSFQIIHNNRQKSTAPDFFLIFTHLAKERLSREGGRLLGKIDQNLKVQDSPTITPLGTSYRVRGWDVWRIYLLN